MLITTLVSLARQVGANRIVAGRGVTHPTGDPALTPREELELRQALVEAALAALTAGPAA